MGKKRKSSQPQGRALKKHRKQEEALRKKDARAEACRQQMCAWEHLFSPEYAWYRQLYDERFIKDVDITGDNDDDSVSSHFDRWLKQEGVQSSYVLGGTLTVAALQARARDPDKQRLALQHLLSLANMYQSAWEKWKHATPVEREMNMWESADKYRKLLDKCISVTSNPHPNALEVAQCQWREAMNSKVMRAFMGEESWEAAKALGRQTDHWVAKGACV